MRILVLGTGNVAKFLLERLHLFTDLDLSIWGRNSEDSTNLAQHYSIDHVKELSELSVDSFDIFLLAVSDKAIQEVGFQLKAYKGIKIHFSGTYSSQEQELQGCIWPIYSIHSGINSYLQPVPLAVVVEDKEVFPKVNELATRLGQPFVINQEQKLWLHSAAVFTNNFMNHMLNLCQQLLQSKNIDPQILIPILNQTVNQFKDGELEKRQTGPAKRGDLETIQTHQNILEEFPEMLAIYNTLTESILNYYSK